MVTDTEFRQYVDDVALVGHSCETLAVMYLQQGPLIAENKPTMHRMHRMHRTLHQNWSLLSSWPALQNTAISVASQSTTTKAK
jgi:hypothetical protein